MKKRYKNIGISAGVFLLMTVLCLACTGETGNPALSHVTPTKSPTAVPTKQPVDTPTAEPKASPTAKPELTKPPVYTPTTEPTITPEPTVTSVLLPTVVPTATAIPTVTMPPTLTPTPTVSPLSLVYAGWQQATGPTGAYQVVFPEGYDKVSVTKEKNYFYYTYTDSQHEGLVFDIIYYPDERILARQEAILAQYPDVVITQEEQGFSYYAETETLCVEGSVYACLYTTLGTDGAMQVENRYPKEQSEEYRKENYNWYICVPE